MFVFDQNYVKDKIIFCFSFIINKCFFPPLLLCLGLQSFSFDFKYDVSTFTLYNTFLLYFKNIKYKWEIRKYCFYVCVSTIFYYNI